MKVSELIRRLAEMPQDADVGHVWDGAMRAQIELVWLTRGGRVATSDFSDAVYDDENFSIDDPAPN